MRGRRVAERSLAVPLAAVLVMGMLPAAVFGSFGLAFPVKAHAASSGTWHGVSYDIDDSGCVTFHAGTMTGGFYGKETFSSYAGFSGVTSVKADGEVMLPQNCSGMFNQCDRLISIDMTNFNSSNTTNMSRMFACGRYDDDDKWVKYSDVSGKHSFWTTSSYSSTLTSLNVSTLDTTRVRDMQGMFSGLSSLELLDVSGFNTSNVTDMNEFANNCCDLQFLDLSSFDTSRVTDMSAMFSRCVKLEQVNISSFDTSQVIHINDMFSSCLSLKAIDVSRFDTSKITNMNGLFNSCESLKTLKVGNFKTDNVTSISSIFSGCSSVTELDLSNFNTSQIQDMSYAFAWCSTLKKVNLAGFDTSKVTDMTAMFDGCRKLTALDLSHFDTSCVKKMGETIITPSAPPGIKQDSVTQHDYLFDRCDSLERVKLGSKFSFCGSESLRLDGSAFPDGNWKSNADGKTYKANFIPNNVAATYTYVPDPRIAALSKGKTVSLSENVNGKTVTMKVKAVKGGLDRRNKTVRVSLRKVVASKKKAFSAKARKKSYKANGKLPKTLAIPEPRWHSDLRYTVVYAQIAPKGFWKTKGVKTIVAPSTITIIGNRAFGKSSVRVLQLRTRLLTNKRVKGCLQSSKMKTVKVSLSKKWQKKTKRTYKKAFAKKNSGRKVKVA